MTTEPPAPPPSPPPSYGAPVAPMPVARHRRTWLIVAIVVGVIVVLGVIGAVATQLGRSNSRFHIVSSQSTDGTFHAGDCVTLTTAIVLSADCSNSHDGQIIQVIHGSETCPAGTNQYPISDGTGDLCIDKGNSKR